jgi:hypothetical protein
MGFRNGAYAKVWEVKPNSSGKSTSVRLSISKKTGEGQYEEDFSGYAAFIATANTQAAALKTGDRIKLGDVDVSSRYDREKKERFFNCKVFSFEPAETAPKATSSAQPTRPQGRLAGAAVEDGGLPDDFPA